MKLEFFAWECGHHQERPEPIDGVVSADQALLILRAIGAAISQPGTARARLVDEAANAFREYYLTDDYAAEQFSTWSDLPVVLVCPDLVGDRRAADALSWHLNLVDDLVDGWGGAAPLHGDSFATTALDLAAVQALPRDAEHPPLRIVEVTPALLQTALEDAIDCGIVETGAAS